MPCSTQRSGIRRKCIMKIAALTPSYIKWEGDTAAVFIHNLTRKLVESGVEVSVVTPMLSPESKPYEVIDGVEINRFHYFWPTSLEGLAGGYGIPDNMKRSFLLALQLPFLIVALLINGLKISRKCDVIHAFWIPSAIIALFIKRLTGKPMAFSPLGSGMSNLPEWFMTYCLRSFDVIFTGTGRWNDSFYPKKLSGDFNIIKAATMVNIDTTSSRPIPDVISELRARKKKVVYFVARMVESKNPMILIDTIPIVLNIRNDVHFVVSGDGPLMEECKARVKQLNIDTNITFTGHITNELVRNYINYSDMIVTTSLVGNCFSTTILDGFHLRKAHVLSNSGATGEFFIHEKYAYLYEAGEPEELARSINLVLNDEKLRETLEKNTYDFLKGNSFMDEITINTIMNTYHQIQNRDPSD